MKYLLLLTLLCTCGPAQAQTHEGLFIFGHSLIDHRPPAIATPSDETTVPHWLHLLAEAAGNSVAAGGQYGFLTSHRNLPPISQWGYDIVAGVWDQDFETFAQADISTTLITVGNFIQNEMTPTEEYYGDENAGVTPVSATQDIIDWVDLQKPGTKVYIYENWPETNLAFPPLTNLTFPLNATEFSTYNAYTQGTFHDWWIAYHDELLASRPDLNVRMVPVGPILSKIFTGSLGDQIPYTELYEDLDPHGRASLYFLASLVTYAAIFQEQAPTDFVVPTIVHEDIRDNYAAINTFIWDELQAFNTPVGDSRVFLEGTVPVTLASFTAAENNGEVVLNWTTSEEEGIEQFVVEHRVPTGNFQPLGLPLAANDAPSDYSFTDDAPFDGENVYRLRIDEMDGEVSYSSLATVTLEGTNSVSLLSAGNGTFTLRDAPRGTEYYFTDATGRLLQKGRIEHPGELLELAGDRFAGVGFLVVTLPGHVPLHFRILLNR